jgi:Holliday junction resolvase RusA-like endonuclease
MQTIKIFIPGQPQGKERARSRIITSRSGKQFTSHYTPSKTRAHEKRIAQLAAEAMQRRMIIDGPVELELKMAFEVPASWPQWKRDMALRGEIVPTVKPDSDNIEKSIKDGMNKIVWLDDCQVTETRKMKFYAERPGVLVYVTPLNAHPAQLSRKPAPESQLDLVGT